MYNIAIFASGSGTNAENIVKTFHDGTLLRVQVVLTDHADAGVCARMERLGVPVEYVPPGVWKNEPEEVVALLRRRNIDMVVLAGFMRLVSPVIVDAFPHRILNLHPALLPAYGGKGMWGHHVHEAVIANGESESGVTVHYVDAEYDHGEILMQQVVSVTPDDTPETLEAKIHQAEYELFPRAIAEALNRMTPPPLDGDTSEHKAKPAAVPPAFPPEVPAERSVDSQWAEVLHMDFDPAMAKERPPHHSSRENATPPRTPGADNPTAQRPAELPPMPPTYLVLSILATILCCFVPGVIAIIFSSRISNLYYQGDYAGAERASRQTQIWIIVSFCLGVLSATLYLPMLLIRGAAGL